MAMSSATGVASSPALRRSVAAARPARAEIESENATQSPRTPESWIADIRRLQREQRIDEVRKQLKAFREAYGERAEQLLPPDLREIH